MSACPYWIFQIRYEFHYNNIKSTYGNRVVLLMTDTDSLVYSIETDDLYDMCHHLDRYDMSEYPQQSPCLQCNQ